MPASYHHGSGLPQALKVTRIMIARTKCRGSFSQRLRSLFSSAILLQASSLSKLCSVNDVSCNNLTSGCAYMNLRIDPFQLVGMQLNWRTEQWVALCMIIDFIAAWRFSFVLSSSSEVLTSHLKGVCCTTMLDPFQLVGM